MNAYIRKTTYTACILCGLTGSMAAGAIDGPRFDPTRVDTTDFAAGTDAEKNRDLLEAYLMRLGVDHEEAADRVSQLSDEEVNDTVAKAGVGALPAGQDSTVTIGIGTAILIAILLLIL